MEEENVEAVAVEYEEVTPEEVTTEEAGTSYDFSRLETEIYPANESTEALATFIRGQGHRQHLTENRLHNFECIRYEGNSKRRILSLVQSILSKHRIVNEKQVILDVVHESRIVNPDNIRPDTFKLIIWSNASHTGSGALADSSHRGVERLNPPRLMWDISCDCRDEAFMPSGRGTSINCTKPNGQEYSVAEVFDNCIVIHHDAVHEGTTQEATILRVILERALSYISNTDEDYAKVQTAREEAIKADFIDAANSIWKNKVTNLNQELHVSKDEAERFRKKLLDKNRLIVMKTNELDALQGTQVNIEQHLTSEYERLLADPRVLKVDIIERKLYFYTDMMRCAHPNEHTMHDIGKFKIMIDLVGTEDINFENLSHRISGYKDGMHAPHVFPNGKACWGNLSDAIPQYVASGEVSIVAQLVMQFLETVNLNDAAGKFIGKWPITKT